VACGVGALQRGHPGGGLLVHADWRAHVLGGRLAGRAVAWGVGASGSPPPEAGG
jgi:hypothetical protein